MRRKTLWGLSFALTTCAWYAWVPLYYHLPVGVGAVLHGLAIMFAVAARWNEPDAPRRLPAVILMLSTLLACAVAFPSLPWGGRIAALTLLAGVVLSAGIRWARLRCIGLAMRTIALVSLSQAACSGLYGLWLATHHYASPLAFFDVYVGRLVGLHVSVIGSHVYFPSPAGYAAVLPSWDQAGLIFGVIALIGILVLIRLLPTGRPFRQVALRATAITMAYLIVRRLFLLLLALQLDRPELFWEPVATLLTFGFLPLILAALALTESDVVGVVPARSFSWKPLSAIAGLAGIGAFLIASSLFLAPPGVKTNGKVVFDEAHGDWESTLRPLDKDWYGMRSTYNYASLYHWLSYYYDVGRITEPLNADVLDGVAILVLKIPSIPYSHDEIETVVSFVESGGGLYVIGDHTNVFGTTSVLNPLLERFGLSLNYDATYDLHTKSYTTFEPPSPSLDPIMQHVKRLDFLTSCTLAGPVWASAALRDTQVLVNQADYATRDFFAEDRVTLSSEFGSFTQNLAIQYKKGRVVVFTDSTCFSNFSIHMDGYPMLVLSTLGFLSRAGSGFSYPILGMALGAVAALGCVLVARKHRREVVLLAVGIGVLFGWGLATLTVAKLHAAWYQLPTPRSTIPYIYFDLEHSEGEVSAQPGSTADEKPPGGTFNTFFVWTQRVDLVPAPVAAGSLSKLVPGRPILLINPKADLDEAFLSELVKYVEDSAGRLVLMGRRDDDPDRLAAILDAFELRVLFDRQAGWLLAEGETYAHEVSPALTLHVSIADRGSGKVVLIGDSVPFSDLSMGGEFNVPSSVQQELYGIEFWLLNRVLAD